MYRTYKTNHAFTLIELLITIVLISFLLGSIWLAYNAASRIFYNQFTRSGIKGESGRFLINIAGEMRRASAVTSAQQAFSTFTLDTDDNGVDETIQYTWSGTAGEPLNRTLTSTTPSFTTTTPVVGSVTNLDFSYYDASGNLLSFPVTGSPVRLVAIDLTAASKDETLNLRSKISLRNL